MGGIVTALAWAGGLLLAGYASGCGSAKGTVKETSDPPDPERTTGGSRAPMELRLIIKPISGLVPSSNSESKIVDFIRRSSSTPLNVNTDPNQHYMTEKSEAEGIKDLQALAIQSEKTKVDEVEEVWIFVEGKDGANRSREFWFEVGIFEKPTRAWVSNIPKDNIVKFLKGQGIKVDRWVDYHYHAISKPGTGTVSWGNLFPSEGDLERVVNTYFEWRDFHLGGTFQRAVVTKHGVWRSEWIGPNLTGDSAKIAEYQKRVGDYGVSVWKSLDFWIEYCLGPTGPCGDFYKDFSHKSSTPWTKTRFHPIDESIIPKGKIYPRLGILKEYVRTANPDNFFQKLSQQMAKDNAKLSGQKLEIQWDDRETIASVMPGNNGGRKVSFNFVIDTNNDPKNGRIYMVDSYWFDKTDQFTGFNRYFSYKPHLPDAKHLDKMAKRYTQAVGKQTHEQALAFAQQVASFYLNL